MINEKIKIKQFEENNEETRIKKIEEVRETLIKKSKIERELAELLKKLSIEDIEYYLDLINHDIEKKAKISQAQNFSFS